MKQHLTLKNLHGEKQQFYYRLLLVGLLIILFIALLIARLIYLQIDKNKLYTALSQKNQLSVLPIPPTRGLIYDRNGVVLAENIPTFNLEIIPEKISHLEATIDALQPLIEISEDDKQRFYRQLEQRRRFDKVPLRMKLSEEEVARFYVNQHRFSGVMINTQLIRHYPQGENNVDVLGYVGRINRYDYDYLNNPNYLATPYVGKIGIEKHYEKVLHGTVGYQQVEADANGRVIRTLKQKLAVPGKNLYLTIDSRLQTAARNALQSYRGAIVAIDPNNGDILALASNPSYDPNLFVQGMSQKTFDQLQYDKQQPLFNRALRGQYALASTIKPFLALMALEQGITTPQKKLHDRGAFKLKNDQHLYRDWKRGGHGWINLSQAITVSCNTYFYDLAVKLGIDNINTILRNFAFGQTTGIDVDEELPGLIPTPEWKYAYHGRHWYTGDTILSGIGQGYILTTPLQLSVATMGLANRGQLYKPHLLKQTEDANGTLHDINIASLPPIQIASAHWNIVINAMQNVIESPQGTGFRFGHTPYSVAAKTGTAQLENSGDKTSSERITDNSIFIAFAPVEKPRIAIAVVIENNSAAPTIARALFDSFFQLDRKSNT
jgi:penicillin-binding protein 2